MEKKFELKVNLTFWVIVMTALMLATLYQASALNRDLARIASSIKIKIPSIIIIGGVAQVFLVSISRSIKKMLGEFDPIQNNAKAFVITLQKKLTGLKRVFIIVNSVGFFLGPTVTFFIYYFTGKPYPSFEIFFIIINHVLIGTLASLLQISLLQIIFQEILGSFGIHENIRELKTMGATKKRRLTIFTLISLYIFLSAGLVYGMVNNISLGILEITGKESALVMEFLFHSLIYGFFLMVIFFVLSKEEQNKFNQIQNSLNKNLESGNQEFSKINIISYDDYGELASSINAYSTRLESLINNISLAGDTVSRTSKELVESIERSESALARMQGLNRDMISQVNKEQEAMSTASSAIDEITRSIKTVEESVSAQSSYVDESSAAISEMSANIQSVARISQKASEETDSLNEMVRSGSGQLEETMGSINNLKEASSRVQTIIKVIQTISSQTNLLAMNAAIEAAHAGAAGAGFSVVADEVRKLAEESSKSAMEIRDIIKEMTNAILQGVESAEKTDLVFGNITRSVENTSRIIDQVTNSMDEQQTAANDITRAMSSLVGVSDTLKKEYQRQSYQSNGMNRAMAQLLDSIENLKEESKRLQLEDTNLSREIGSLNRVSEINGEAIASLEKAVRDY